LWNPDIARFTELLTVVRRFPRAALHQFKAFMWKFVILAIVGIPTLVAATSIPANDTALDRASRALNTTKIETLRFSASGATYTVGQNFAPDLQWPRVSVKSYTASINYQTSSMQIDLLRQWGTTMPRGGGVPFTGELHQIQVVSGPHAWNVPVNESTQGGAAPATPCTIPEAGGTVWAGPGGSPQPTPAPESQAACMLMLWATPQGFVKAAMANKAILTAVDGGTEVSFTIDGKYWMVGFINTAR
jgi:hypothetical protein